MRKLLIAEHSEVRKNALTEVLQKDWEIYTCMDSYPVIDTMRYIKPDAMIVNLNIGPQDGLAVLQEGFPELPPVIMALTNFTSPYIERTAESLGVGYMMLVPCRADYVRDRLNDMFSAYLETPTITARHLRTLMINSRLSGYQCLLAAIPLFAKDPHQQMKELYPEVASRCGLNDARCVERDIRTAITDAWKRRSTDTWALYFPTNEDGDVDLPTNKLFIKTLSESI